MGGNRYRLQNGRLGGRHFFHQMSFFREVGLQAKERIICPLDVDNSEKAIELVQLLKDSIGVFKVGLELTTSVGFQVLEPVKRSGARSVFLDLKLHDIPNTVAGAMRGVVRLGVWCVTVHAFGGQAMLEAAVEAAKMEAEISKIERPKVFAVTLLTSISAKSLLEELKVCKPVQEYVVSLALMAFRAGCDGVIASPHEIEAIRRAIPDPSFLVVTPGVRPAGTERGDQARVMTPGEAISKGANYLVIGRPIYNAIDPKAAADKIAEEIEAAL